MQQPIFIDFPSFIYYLVGLDFLVFFNKMPKKTLFHFIALQFLITTFLFSQIKIKEAIPQNLRSLDPVFFDVTSTRSIIQLNEDWQAFNVDEPETKTDVTLPATYSGRYNLSFERKLNFTKYQLEQKNIDLVFLGLNYAAEFVLNEVVIYKHPGGAMPFNVTLPNDILFSDGNNSLIVNVNYRLDSEATIPLKHRFQFPRNLGGFTGDVYLHLCPNTGIDKFDLDVSLLDNSKKAVINLAAQFIQSQTALNDTTLSQNLYTASILIKSKTGEIVTSLQNLPINFTNNYFEKNFSVEIKNPILWSPNTPKSYLVTLQLFNGDQLLDESTKSLPVYKLELLKEEYRLNGNKFNFEGTSYFTSETPNGNLAGFDNFDDDIKIIKSLGFNSIRFAKSLPHPYALYLCEKYGLLAFVESPLNSIPDEFADDNNFFIRANTNIGSIFDYYSMYKIVAGYGLGSSYLANSDKQIAFVEKMANSFNERTDKIIYASFIGIPNKKLNNLDLYGIEIISEYPELSFSRFQSEADLIGKHNIFISEATYPTYKGGTNGYANKYSLEGQAKFFEKIIDFQRSNKLPGFFTNSVFDFKGDYEPLYSGYTGQMLHQIGILDIERNIGRLSSKLFKYKLGNGDKVTIPIGSQHIDSPIAFILIGVGLSLFMALLINSKRKFREDASRALIRPYNFFADIRDHRILSGLHSTLLMICLAGVLALLLTIILFYLRNNFMLDKILISFGWINLTKFISYLAWNPLEAFIYLYIFSIGKFLLHTLVIRVLSFFVKTKVLTTSIFFTVVWAFLPLALLLPLELILHRVLTAEIANLYIYLFITLYMLWLAQRLVKGIYVIFDVRSSTIYFYSFLIFIFLVGGVLVYFQLSESTIYFIINSIKQYQLI